MRHSSWSSFAMMWSTACGAKSSCSRLVRGTTVHTEETLMLGPPAPRARSSSQVPAKLLPLPDDGHSVGRRSRSASIGPPSQGGNE